MRIPQVSSPVMLPDWFPVQPGREVYVRLLALADKVEVALLNAEEARVERLSELLFNLESMLAKRLVHTFTQNPRSLKRLVSEFETVLPDEPGSEKELVDGFRKHLSGVGSPRAYRPSVRKATSLSALLIRLVMKKSPDGIGKGGRRARRGALYAEQGDNAGANAECAAATEWRAPDE